MPDAATLPIEALPPERQRTVPGRIGLLLGLVHTLIAYGRNLAATLQLHVAEPQLLPCFAYIATAFDISSLPLILNRIARGLLRAAALQERLRHRAAHGRDFELRPRIRPPSARPSHGGKRTHRLHDPARNRFFACPPTLNDIAAEDRRRPIAAILYDICLDFGIEPNQLDKKAWIELCRDIIDYRGNLVTFMTTRWRRPPAPINPVANPAGRKSQAHSATSTQPPPTAFPAWRAPCEQLPPLVGRSSREADRWWSGPDR